LRLEGSHGRADASFRTDFGRSIDIGLQADQTRSLSCRELGVTMAIRERPIKL